MSLSKNQKMIKIELISEDESGDDDNCDYIIADLDKAPPVPDLSKRNSKKVQLASNDSSNRIQLPKSGTTNTNKCKRLLKTKDSKTTEGKNINAVLSTDSNKANSLKKNQQLLSETRPEKNSQNARKPNMNRSRTLQTFSSKEGKNTMDKLRMMTKVLLRNLDTKKTPQENTNLKTDVNMKTADNCNSSKESDLKLLTADQIKKEIIETDDSSNSSSSSSDSSSENDSGTSDSEEDSSSSDSVRTHVSNYVSADEEKFDASLEVKNESKESQNPPPVYYFPYLAPKTENASSNIVVVQEATVLPYKGQKRGPKRKKPIKVRDKPMRKRPGEPFIPIECPQCDKTFKYISLLRQHQVVHSTESLFDCEECGKGFKRRSTLNEHRARHTTGKVQNNDQTYYDDSHSNKSKPKILPVENLHVCEYCGKSSSSFSNLELHIRTHTNERPYPCETCPKSFRNSYELKLHIRTHTLEKPFTCELCNRSFSVARTLKIHYMRHAGEKPFECTEEDCGKTFTVKLELQRHISKIHGGIIGGCRNNRKVHCEECGRSFSHIGILKDHLLIHNGIKPFQCPFCDVEFRQANHLDYHIRVHKNLF